MPGPLPNVELKEFSLPNRFLFDPAAKFLSLPKIDKLLGGANIFFAPHFLLAPVSAACRKVTTFHDLSFEYFPEFFPWRKRLWHQFLAPRERARGADKIIAVSESTKNDLIDLYAVPPAKIKVIYSGVGEEYKKIINNPLAAGQIANVKEKYNLPEKFILYFGTLEPRKNVVGLIHAYEIWRQRYKGDHKLVIAGQRGWLFDDILTAAKASPLAADLFFTGFIEPADKVYLYNLASLFVFPSFFEGFGFPPLEAMACGVPTITSNTSCFPEIVGEASLMVDPYNYEEIAWAMNEILADENLKNDLIAAGLRQAKRFSWDRCAQETMEFMSQ
ncbi:MAG: Group 1 glycosyl transferase [Parcubacteria group bacterium GW2011_GWF2_44_7]|nr:MAG: Group 1 glycosyl transferase [Parcubacteria group bacterium GW2011_GWF2_44_7]